MTREHILREIKRTAEANGGVPLGMKTFEKQTGIKIGDWLGRHWARWGDSIREAGLTPNQMTKAYDESLLMEKYIRLARKLGKLPVKADLQLERRSDVDFPDPVTFGSKPALVRRVGAYCRNRSGYEDIVRMCEEYVAPTMRKPPEKAQDLDGDGYVYLAKSGRFYKIGRTNSTGRREYEIGIQLPERLSTVHVISTDDPAGIEAYWHNRFQEKRKKGEWFQLTAADISAFKRRKFM